jgi:phage gpG-like protein
MVELKFNIKDEISPRMAALLDSFKDFTQPLKKAEEYMLGSITETFRVGGRPEKWAPLKPSSILARIYRHHQTPRREDYATEKAYQRALKRIKEARKKAREKTKALLAAGANIPILVDKGTLMRSVTARTPTDKSIRKLTRTELVIGTNVEYAPYHQYGTKYIPARPFLQILPEDKENITKIFKDWLEKIAGYKGG